MDATTRGGEGGAARDRHPGRGRRAGIAAHRLHGLLGQTVAGGTPIAEYDASVCAMVETDLATSGRQPGDPVAVAAEAIRDEITTRLAPSGVNSIAEVKAAVIEGLDAAVARLS